MAKILIVDDEPDITSALGRYFERAGHDVLRAATGEEGVALAASEHPAVMLLDLHLPDISGFDVLERTREQRPVVIMITGHGDIPLAVQAMQGGAEGFLTKPVELAHLGAVVDRALEKAQLRELSRSADMRIGRASTVLPFIEDSTLTRAANISRESIKWYAPRRWSADSQNGRPASVSAELVFLSKADIFQMYHDAGVVV